MKKLAVVLILVLITFTTKAQETKGATITVVIENVGNDEGSVLGSLHTADTFMKGPGVVNASAPATAGEVTLTFTDVAPGTFAIMVMHDANDNKQMDFEASGMPKESYGTSGEMNLYGPPSFNSAQFEVTVEDQEIRIRM